MTVLKVACIGEALIEISSDGLPGVAALNVAGDTLNTAIYLRRNLAQESSVSFVTALGGDALSGKMIDFMASEGICTEHIHRSAVKLPGLYAIELDQEGERSFYYWRENSAARDLFQNGDTYDFSPLAGFDVLYYSAITLAILPDPVRLGFLQWLEGFRAKGGVVAFDSNFRPPLWKQKKEAREVIKKAHYACDILLPSLDDEIRIFGDSGEAAAIERLRRVNAGLCVVKRGGSGPIALNPPQIGDGEFSSAISVVDSTGAGDSFNGAFLARYLQGSGIRDAMQAGHNCAMQVIQQKGAIIPK